MNRFACARVFLRPARYHVGHLSLRTSGITPLSCWGVVDALISFFSSPQIPFTVALSNPLLLFMPNGLIGSRHHHHQVALVFPSSCC